MANVDFPHGFLPIRNLNGGELRTNPYILTTGQTVFRGDLVKLVAGGTVEEADANDGVVVIGVAATQVNDSTSVGGKVVQVYDNPDTIFEVQADSGTALAATDVGATANHVAGTGSSTSKLSGHELDADDVGSGLQMRILRKSDRQDSTVSGNEWAEHVDLEVLILEHALRNAATI